MKDQMCPICGEGQLHEQSGANTVEYNGCEGVLETFFSVCDVCGSEQSNAQQLRDNKRQMIAFRKHVDGLLSGSEIAAIREQLGLNKKEAAKIFGGGPVSFTKYESDDVAQSEAMDNLLRVAAAIPATLGFLSRNVKLRKPHADKLAQHVQSGSWEKIPVGRGQLPATGVTLKVLSKNDLNSGFDWSDKKECA